MKRKLKFKDKKGFIAFIELEITTRNGYLELTISGEYNGGHGQVDSYIKPRTELQKELLILWDNLHLKEVTPQEIDAINELCNELETEEKKRIGDPTFEKFIEENFEGEAIAYIRENGSFENDKKVLALCLEEGLTLSELDSITEEYGNTLSYDGREWLVCTDDEADQAQDEEFDNYIEEFILSELPKGMQNYFDTDSWKDDAKMDGRGHSLARYDGHEQEQTVGETTYYLYRQ